MVSQSPPTLDNDIGDDYGGGRMEDMQKEEEKFDNDDEGFKRTYAPLSPPQTTMIALDIYRNR